MSSKSIRLTNDEYHGINYREYLSSSDIKVLVEKTPAHFKHYMNQKSVKDEGKKSAALILGNQYHELLQSMIETGSDRQFFSNNLILEDVKDVPINKNTGKPFGMDTVNMSKFLESSGIDYASLITREDYKMINGMKNVIWNDMEIRKMLYGAICEESFLNESFSGIKTKYRTDIRIEKPNLVRIIDFKTGLDGDPHPLKFPKIIAKYQYHVSAAFYVDNDRHIHGYDNGVKTEFYWIVQEKEEPYGFEIYAASRNMLAFGTYQYQAAIDVLKYCTENNYWPSYKIFRPKTENGQRYIQHIDLPDYYTGSLHKKEIVL